MLALIFLSVCQVWNLAFVFLFEWVLVLVLLSFSLDILCSHLRFAVNLYGLLCLRWRFSGFLDLFNLCFCLRCSVDSGHMQPLL